MGFTEQPIRCFWLCVGSLVHYLVDTGLLLDAGVRCALRCVEWHDLLVGRAFTAEATGVLHERSHLVEGNLLASLVERVH